MLKITKKNIKWFAIAMFSFLLIVILPKGSSDSICVQTTIVSINCIPLLLNSFKKKHYLFLSFVALTFETMLVITLFKYILNVPETSWRRAYEMSRACETSLYYIAVSLLILVLIYWLVSQGFEQTSIRSWNAIKLNRRGYVLLTVLALVYAVVFAFEGGFLTVRNYETDGSSSMISIYRIIQALLITISFCADFPIGKNIYRALRCISMFSYVLLDVAMGVVGYRFILVEVLFFILFLNLTSIKRVKPKTIIITIVGLTVLYFILTYIRNRIMGGGAGIESLFRHERNIFYSLVAIVINRPRNGINTYYNTILNLLPRAITGFKTDNTGRILIRYIYRNLYDSSSRTMGAFYLTEAYYNFGAVGIVCVTFTIGIILSFLEWRRKNYNVKRYSIYYFFAAQMYNVVYYGSSNYVKILFYYVIFVYCYEVLGKITTKRHVKNLI